MLPLCVLDFCGLKYNSLNASSDVRYNATNSTCKIAMQIFKGERMKQQPPYLKLNAEVEAEIKHNLKHNIKHPYACKNECALRREANKHDVQTLSRPAFSRDIDKIINMPAYNRYAGKTQVFSLVENDDISRRGLHVQLVSRIARNIGRLLGLNCELIEAIALGHDVGHTPFGHAGEHFLSEIYHSHTNKFFKHNVHSLRVLDKLYRRNISLQVLDGALCHNGEFAQQVLKLGNTKTFEQLDALARECTEDKHAIKKLRPSTLEGCVVRVSDMIAYIGKDRQDSINIGVLENLDAFESNYIGTDNARIINNLTVDIVNESYGKNCICLSKAAFDDLKRAKAQNYEIIYNNEGWRAGSENVVGEMFSQVYEQLLDDLEQRREGTAIFKHHAAYLQRQSHTISASEYIANTEPNQVVVDYMASMTDAYFVSLYAHLFPNFKHTAIAQGYCAALPARKA